jgi:hypothetical protein
MPALAASGYHVVAPELAQLAAPQLQRLQRPGQCGTLRARFANAANRPEQYSGSTVRNAAHHHHSRTDREAVRGVHYTREVIVDQPVGPRMQRQIPRLVALAGHFKCGTPRRACRKSVTFSLM